MSLDIPDEARKAGRDEELAQTRFERSYWRDLVASNLSDLLRGMSKRASFFRRQYVEAARLFEVLQRENADLRAKLAEHQKRAPLVVAAELDRLAAEFELDGCHTEDRVADHMNSGNQTGAALAVAAAETYEAIGERLASRARELRGGTQ